MLRARQPRGTAPSRALRNATIGLAVVAGCARGWVEGAIDAAATGDAHVAVDAHLVAPDAALDAGCAISAGMTPMLDGTSDLAKYPSPQHVVLGAMLGSDDAAIAWDHAELYVTVTSSAFTAAYEPIHLYVEA